MSARAHVIVSGRVQGVFYRAYTRNHAVKLGLQGWVRNLPDGRVEAVFEGDRELLERAISACRKGPEDSLVRDVEITWEDPADEQGFEIRY